MVTVDPGVFSMAFLIFFFSDFAYRKAIDPFGDVILAMTMNGETLPADHGFPVRVLMPGFAGVRNCKWLAKMELVDDLQLGGFSHASKSPRTMV